MTSEVAVMNRLAVALAADSAVSVSAGRRNKVYNSANKLFMLSQVHPVGIMVYSNGSLMGVPWEVLIKTFRNMLKYEEFDTLAEYGEHFVTYIEDQKSLFTAALERSSYLKMVESEYIELSRKIQREVLHEETQIKEDDDWPTMRKAIVSRMIRECHKEWADRDRHPEIAEDFAKTLRGSCSGEIANLTAAHFRTKSWACPSEDTHLLYELADFYVEKDYIAPSSFSGVVIAGFGRNEFFPVLRRYRFGDIYDGRLKKFVLDPVEINDTNPVHVGVYADSDMADLFLKGVSAPALDFITEQSFKRAVEIADAALELTGVEITPELQKAADTKRDEAMLALMGDLQKFRTATSEFERALIHIPKDELASVAASLVNLNSFKKRISMSVESVGGPVDVAVISKGDGFIWIDRKHYFAADKNPHFMRRQDHLHDSQGSI